jgi:predicted GNAT superfamily acetyltransferase
MTVEYKELTEKEHFRQCADLQKRIFGVNEVDILAPHVVNMLVNKKLSLGVGFGAFEKVNGKDNLIGFIINCATFSDHSFYGIMVGISPEYRSQNIGFGLINKIREVGLERKIFWLYGIFDPLEGNLGNLYFNKFGFLGVKYEKSAYELNEDYHSAEKVPVDKVLFRWDMYSSRANEKLAGTYQKKTLPEVLKQYPLIQEDRFVDSDGVLVEIPEDFLALKGKNRQEALRWRLRTGKIFDEYVNNRGFHITEFYSERTNGKRKNYYLLESR